MSIFGKVVTERNSQSIPTAPESQISYWDWGPRSRLPPGAPGAEKTAGNSAGLGGRTCEEQVQLEKHGRGGAGRVQAKGEMNSARKCFWTIQNHKANLETRARMTPEGLKLGLHPAGAGGDSGAAGSGGRQTATIGNLFSGAVRWGRREKPFLQKHGRPGGLILHTGVPQISKTAPWNRLLLLPERRGDRNVNDERVTGRPPPAPPPDRTRRCPVLTRI